MPANPDTGRQTGSSACEAAERRRPSDAIAKARDAAILREQAAGNLPKLLLTGSEVEQLTGLCLKTIKKHVAPKKIGRAVRWRYADLENWVNGAPPDSDKAGGQ